ncbi:MAG: ion transporter [Myxococcota bacterium]
MHLIQAAYHRPSTAAYQRTEWAGWVLTVISVVLVLVELLFSWGPQAHAAFLVADRVLVALFALDLVLRVLSYAPPELVVFEANPARLLSTHVMSRLRFLFLPFQLIDLITILSFVPALRALRALRLLRLARGIKMFKYADPIRGLFRALEESWLLYGTIFSFLLSAVVVGGTSLFLLEQGSNPSIARLADGLWWALVTITTVGFGDITPVTTGGRIVGVAVMVAGMFTLALAAGVVSVTLLGVVTRLREEQFRMSTHTAHVVVLGYDSGSSMLLNALLEEVSTEEQEVVLMGRGERPRDLPSDFTWVNGDATKEQELGKVRLASADTVLVVAPRRVEPQAADARSILTLFTLRSYLQKQPQVSRRKREVYVVAEILDAENVGHAARAGANEVIETTRLGFAMMAHAVRAKGTADIMTKVAAAGALSMYIGCQEVQASTYREASDRLRERYDVTVIGIREREAVRLGPPPDHPVGPNTEWIYLAPTPCLPESA